ncbi:MAG: RNA helicase, partial [Gammaproteobacteria bacterium]
MTEAIAAPDDDDALIAELAAEVPHARLVKMEGRVFVQFSGAVEASGLRVPYELVPAQGVLAKPSKWRKLDADARRALLRERVTRAAYDALQGEVRAFVREIALECEDHNLDAALFLHTLADLDTSEPASYVFERIRQRFEH